jgi:hypothetical protein
MATLTIANLPSDNTAAPAECTTSLSLDDMKRVRGGRAVSVLVDGRPGGIVDDFVLNMEIFKGNIGRPMLL